MLVLLLAGTFMGTVRAESVQERFQDAINSWMKFFETNLQWLSVTVTDFLKKVLKITYFTIGLAGFVMWASGFSKYTGRRLMLGALAMALVSEVLL